MGHNFERKIDNASHKVYPLGHDGLQDNSWSDFACAICHHPIRGQGPAQSTAESVDCINRDLHGYNDHYCGDVPATHCCAHRISFSQIE